MSGKQNGTNGPASTGQDGTGTTGTGEEIGAAGTGPQNGSRGRGTQDRDGAGGSGTGQGTGGDQDGGDQATGDQATGDQGGGDQGGGDQGGGDQGGGEAGRWRRRTRDAERERDTARELVAALQTDEVARVAADTLAEPGDLLSLGDDELGAYVGEDGRVDADRVRTAAAALVRSRPGLAASGYRPFTGDIGGGNRLGGGKPRGGGWAGALRGK